jgi:hypothetical protein
MLCQNVKCCQAKIQEPPAPKPAATKLSRNGRYGCTVVALATSSHFPSRFS